MYRSVQNDTGIRSFHLSKAWCVLSNIRRKGALKILILEKENSIPPGYKRNTSIMLQRKGYRYRYHTSDSRKILQ